MRSDLRKNMAAKKLGLKGTSLCGQQIVSSKTAMLLCYSKLILLLWTITNVKMFQMFTFFLHKFLDVFKTITKASIRLSHSLSRIVLHIFLHKWAVNHTSLFSKIFDENKSIGGIAKFWNSGKSKIFGL